MPFIYSGCFFVILLLSSLLVSMMLFHLYISAFFSLSLLVCSEHVFGSGGYYIQLGLFFF